MTQAATPTARSHIFLAYLRNITAYLQRQFPMAPVKAIDGFARAYIEKHCDALQRRLEQALDNNEDLTIPRPHAQMLWPTARIVKHIDPHRTDERHSYGNMVFFEHEDLLKHVSSNRTKILSPFGSYYETTDVCTSFLKGMVDDGKKRRKGEKKAMLQAKKDGDIEREQYHNGMQASIKISANSLPGAMGNSFNFMSSKANFNSVTSIARYVIMNSYAHAERFLEANFYFANEDQLTNFIITCVEYGPDPDQVLDTVKRYGFKMPTWQEVYTFLSNQLHQYTFASEHPSVQVLLAALHPGQLCFLYYMSNMKHLVMENHAFFHPWAHDLFCEDHVVFDPSVRPEDVRTLDEDLVIVMSTAYNRIMPVNEKGNSISVYDCIEAYPELAQRFVCIGRYMQQQFDGLQEIFTLFMDHRVSIAHVPEHKNMFRHAVILSDTDSIIFTTKTWVQWYSGQLRINSDGDNANALIVYWLSKANAYILHHVSQAVGAIGADLKTMAMKNEFMMPIEILTSLKKHYASILKIQEGVFYATPRLDIKGVGLRGSNYSKGTLTYTEWFIQSAIDSIVQHGTVSMQQKIVEILRFERAMYDSLRLGETRYLTVNPIKNREEYSAAESSIYFNYLFWEQVFGDTYGNIMIPTKCFMLPLTNVRGAEYMDFLEQQYPDIAKKLHAFMEQYPMKDITRIPINPMTNQIPAELTPIISYKRIIYENAKPLYLVMQSFGIGNGCGKANVLFSDTYGWVNSDEAAKAHPHMA